jgi:ribonuclease HII
MSSRITKTCTRSVVPPPGTGSLSFEWEQRFWGRGIEVVAGVDEAGRGPLAGPVVVAAVVVAPGTIIEGVNDSKKLTPARRDRLYDIIMEKALSVGTAVIPVGIIDEINIFQATLRGMQQAVASLRMTPGQVLVDGPHHPPSALPHLAIVDGDAKVFSIAAASVVAKVTRDRIMMGLHRDFPQYGFDRHKGYGTPDHLAALRRYGPCEHHRKSFHMPQREEYSADEQPGSGEAGRGRSC